MELKKGKELPSGIVEHNPQKWWYSDELGEYVRAVYTAVATQYDIVDGEPNFIPCLVVEGEKGYYPLRGRGESATPWYWGSLEECHSLCDKRNKKHGFSPKEVALMVAGSMRRD